MDTLEFFNRILPQQGYRVLMVLDKGRAPRHVFCESHEVAAAAALKLDAKHDAVYHACATFKTKDSRKQENAGWMKSFWVDLDVDPSNPEKYPSLREAIADVGRVCKELDLRLPLIVKSGAGAHCYWTLSDTITADQWQRAAHQLKSCLDSLGCRQDRTRTADASSVLRPVGTTWRKRADRSVSVIHPGVDIGYAEFTARLDRYAGQHDLVRGPIPTADFAVGDDDLGAPPEYPPSSADRAIQFCPTLAHIAEQRGNVEEPLWRAMLGLVKFTVEGDQRAHEWSAGHPEYDEALTQDKIDRWEKGPTTCAHFRGTNGNKCNGCERKCSSPIQLGYSDEAPAPAITTADADTPLVIPYWPERHFHYDGKFMCRAVPDAEGAIHWVPFCNTLCYPTKRVRLEDGTWSLVCTYVKRRGVRGEFSMPTEKLGRLSDLNQFLASHEIIIMGPKGTQHMHELFSNYMADLQMHNEEQITYAKCGWADDGKSFVIGNRRITVENEEEILAGEQMRKSGWAVDLGVKGTVEEWTALMNTLYARPGAEAFQFVIGGAFAAPLVEIAGIDNWHGIPIALTGPTGLGKSTTARIACSIYGKGDHFLRTASKDGATLNAVISRIGIARNLPVLFDEVTDRDVSEVCSLLYMFSNGRPKDRNRADGSIIDLGLSWNTIPFVTANINITEYLWSLEKQGKQSATEATQLRVFEIPVSAGMTDIWGDINGVDLIEHQLGELYGAVGRVWLRYVIEHRGELRTEIRKMRTKFGNSAEETKERFFRDLIVSVIVALKHAKKLGLLNFDTVALATWAKKHIGTMRRARHEFKYSPEDHIAQFLHSLHGHILVTSQYRDGRRNMESPLEEIRGAPLARMAIEDKAFVVTAKALNDWCIDNRLQPSTLIEEMNKRGYIRYTTGSQQNGAHKGRLTKGTALPSAPALLFELDYGVVFGQIMPGATGDNVVPLMGEAK